MGKSQKNDEKNKRKAVVSPENSQKSKKTNLDQLQPSDPQFAMQTNVHPHGSQTQGTLCSPSGPGFYQYQPPMAQYPTSQPNFQAPPWIQDLTASIDQIKAKLDKLDLIDTEVKKIGAKMATVETSITSIDSRVAAVEKSTQFLSECYEGQKQHLANTAKSMSDIKKDINELHQSNEKLQRDNSQLHEAIIDLQSRSMRENLLFFGVVEDANEDCSKVVTEFCENKLGMADAGTTIRIDRARRLGFKKHVTNNRPRPIVVKFHRYSDEEAIKAKGPSC
jgi:cell division protein FtsB